MDTSDPLIALLCLNRSMQQMERFQLPADVIELFSCIWTRIKVSTGEDALKGNILFYLQRMLIPHDNFYLRN